MDLVAELEKYGPGGTAAALSGEEARAYCRRLAESHYENFTVASRLIPKHLRQHLCNVYAYCRWADDLADEVSDRAESMALMDWWEGELDAAYGGEARHPVFIALRETCLLYTSPSPRDS